MDIVKGLLNGNLASSSIIPEGTGQSGQFDTIGKDGNILIAVYYPVVGSNHPYLYTKSTRHNLLAI